MRFTMIHVLLPLFEIYFFSDPSPGDQIVAMRLLRRTGMETRMEMIDQMKRD